MSLQLENIFSGVRRRRGKEQRDALVERIAMRAVECSARCYARRERAADNAVDDTGEIRSRKPDDADAAAPRGRRDCGDDVGVSGFGHAKRLCLITVF